MLEEANARLKKIQITEDQLCSLRSLYILLDLHKNDFCKIVDAVGLEPLLKMQAHYDRLEQAENEFAAKERYIKAKARLLELSAEKADLDQIIYSYKPFPT